MPSQSRIVAPCPDERAVRTSDGQELQVPHDWALLPPGDAALTRRVKAAGPSWTVQQKRGRKLFSLGVWAPASTIESIRQTLARERSTASYAKRRTADAAHAKTNRRSMWRRSAPQCSSSWPLRLVTRHWPPGWQTRLRRMPRPSAAARSLAPSEFRSNGGPSRPSSPG